MVKILELNIRLLINFTVCQKLVMQEAGGRRIKGYWELARMKTWLHSVETLIPILKRI